MCQGCGWDSLLQLLVLYPKRQLQPLLYSGVVAEDIRTAAIPARSTTSQCSLPSAPFPPATPPEVVSVLLPLWRPSLCSSWPGRRACLPFLAGQGPWPDPRSAPGKGHGGTPSECRCGGSFLPTYPAHPSAVSTLVSRLSTSSSLHCFKISPLLSKKNFPVPHPHAPSSRLTAGSSCCYNNEHQPGQIGQTPPHFPACIQITSLCVNTLGSSSLHHLPTRGILRFGGCRPSAPPHVPPFPSVHTLQPPRQAHTHDVDHIYCPTYPPSQNTTVLAHKTHAD